MKSASAERPKALMDTSVALPGVSGGATYDGLVGATAAEAHLPLLTLDRRARRTYEAVGARVLYLG